MTVNNVYTTRAEFHDSLEPEMVGGGLGTGWQSQSKEDNWGLTWSALLSIWL